MYNFYVEIPQEHNYKDSGWVTRDEAVTLEFGAQMRFVCNPAPYICEGQIYGVELKHKKDELFFLIKSGLCKVDSEKVYSYMRNQPVYS